MLESGHLSQPKLFAEFCHFVKLIQLVQQQLKLDFFLLFFGNYFRWNLISLYFLKTFKPLSKILLLVGKCNPHDSVYTVIFLFVGKAAASKWEVALISLCTGHCLERGWKKVVPFVRSETKTSLLLKYKLLKSCGQE